MGQVTHVRSRAGRRKTLVRACLLAFLNGIASACYTNVPVTGVTSPGSVIVLDVNDRGRVGLGENIGPLASSVEGALQSQNDSVYTLRVTSVGYLNGQTNRWTGEPLSIRKDFVAGVKEHKFAPARTWLVAAGATAAVLGFALTRGLLGSGNPDTDKQPGGGNNQ